jgi:hypothetical protein
MNIKVWHCYWYGPHETIVMLAETEDALRAKVREAIAEGWDADEDGPLPEDFSELVDRYQEVSGDTCYFGDYTYTVLDSALCEHLPE